MDYRTSVESRAFKIRQDWSAWDLTQFSDRSLVQTWSDWFLSRDSEGIFTFIEDLEEKYNVKVQRREK